MSRLHTILTISLVYLTQQYLNLAFSSEEFTSKVICLGDNVKFPKKENLISIEWFKLRETDFREKIFKFEFGTERISHYKTSLKLRTIFNKSEPFSLEFSNSRMEDGGLYECILKHSENGKDSHFKNYISLNVPHPPTTIYIEDMEGTTVKGVYLDVIEGDEIELTCIALNGYPKPILQWQLDDKIIRGITSNEVDPNNIKKSKVSNTMDSMKAVPELSDGKLTCKILQDLSDNKKYPFASQRTIILRVKKSQHPKRKEPYMLARNPISHSVEDINSISEPYDSSTTGRLNSRTTANATTINTPHAPPQTSNFTYEDRVENDSNNPITSALKKLLLDITRNIFVITVMFIIVIVLLVCMYAISRCEKVIGPITRTNRQAREGPDYENSASDDSTYQAANNIRD